MPIALAVLTLMAHRDGRHPNRAPSLSGHCGHGPVFIVQRSVAIDRRDLTHSFDDLVSDGEKGRKRAKANGVQFGRKPKLTPHQRREALERREAGNPSQQSLGRMLYHKARYRGSPGQCSGEDRPAPHGGRWRAAQVKAATKLRLIKRPTCQLDRSNPWQECRAEPLVSANSSPGPTHLVSKSPLFASQPSRLLPCQNHGPPRKPSCIRSA